MLHTATRPLALVAALALAGAARADTLPDSSLTLNLSEILAQPPAEPPPAPSTPAERTRSQGYGESGSRWWTIGAAYANDFRENTDLNIHGAFSQFITDELEFAVEAAGWYFAQDGDDTGGISGSMVFRWHFWHADDYQWTVFADAGIGILGSFANVPDGGTSFNFLPRIGIGYTRAFNESIDGESRGPRWMVGIRYHHISNGRIGGDTSNPARDAVCIYAAITFPF